MDTYTLHRGTAPLLVSLPHNGTSLPDDIAARLTPEARRRVYELDKSYIAVIRELLDTAIAESGWEKRDAELAANFIYFICCIWPLRHWTIGKFGQKVVADEIVDFALNGLSGTRRGKRRV